MPFFRSTTIPRVENERRQSSSAGRYPEGSASQQRTDLPGCYSSAGLSQGCTKADSSPRRTLNASVDRSDDPSPDAVDALAEGLADSLRIGGREDCDQTISSIPAVTQETVIPHVHEVREEHIFRDIHHHDVHTYVQPVYDVEVLPARHFVPGPDDTLIEVDEHDIRKTFGKAHSVSGDKDVPGPTSSTATSSTDTRTRRQSEEGRSHDAMPVGRRQ